MKALVIEDDINKARALVDYINESMPSVEVVCVHSYKNGIKEILSTAYSFVLLDMSMPTFDVVPGETGGKPSPLAGKDILYRMKIRNVMIPTIVVTQYDSFEGVPLDKLAGSLNEQFADSFVGYVYYNSAVDEWKARLRGLIEGVVDGADKHIGC